MHIDLPDTDTQTLTTHYTINDDWWAEARIIARAIIDNAKPTAGACKAQPWVTIATYMIFNDVDEGLNKFFAGQPLDIRLAVSAAISTTVQEELAAAAAQAQQANSNNKPTDDELRDRWHNAHNNVAYGMGEWRQYGNGLWPVAEETAIKQQVMCVLEDAKREGIRPTANLLGSVMTFAQVKTFVPSDLWDNDPDLLVCTNGMLHIPSKALQNHNPDAYQTTGVPYAYDPDAECPAFIGALSRLPYRVTQFLQEFAGYCLTVDTSHEIAVWFWGIPGSGKSTLIEGFNAMLGDRAGVLSLKQVSQSRFGLSNIEGKTLIYAFESPALYLETTDILNAIVSGEAVPVERKFKDPVTIRPRAKILWAMNSLPTIQDAGDGIFRRVKIVHFDPLPETQKDITVKETIKTEGPGILNWALLGLERLRNRGRFLIPPEIKDTTDDFQSGNDPASAFIRECCIVDLLDPNLEEQSAHLYKAYTAWCYENGHKSKSSTKIATEWKRLGFTQARKTAGVFWQGVEIMPGYHP